MPEPVAFPFIELPPREQKPRGRGLTMVIDKHLGLNATRDLIDTAGPYIDVVKFGWGTSRLFPEGLLREKVAMLRAADIQVCPGGTFMEIAYDRDAVPEFLRYARDIGFSAIEVSNGIHPHLTATDKQEIIRAAKDLGFYTVSEVGRKLTMEDRHLTVDDRVREVVADLAAGSAKVIMEARESGSLGIFDDDGRVNSTMAYSLFQHVDPDLIVWEAPRKPQQVWLLQNLGPDANLGNIAPEEAISVETLRRGLRGDTMRDYSSDAVVTYLELGVGGAIRARRRGDIVVVVDALRASATIIEALAAGARAVRPVVSVDELSGEVTAGERGGQKLETADYSNSPTEMSRASLGGKELVLSTTNGTECIRAAKDADNVVLIGTVGNCRAVAAAATELARTMRRNITLLAAGRNNLPAIEDRIAVTEILRNVESPIVRGMLEACDVSDIAQAFLDSDAGRNLTNLGYGHDVTWCAVPNRHSVVPVFDGRSISILADHPRSDARGSVGLHLAR